MALLRTCFATSFSRVPHGRLHCARAYAAAAAAAQPPPHKAPHGGGQAPPPGTPQDLRQLAQTLNIVSLVEAFRSRGHYCAALDPLGRSLGPLTEGNDAPGGAVPAHAADLYHLLRDYPKLDLAAVGLGDLNPDQRYFLGGKLKIRRAQQLFWTAGEVVELLRGAYCGTSTVEYAHLAGAEQKRWVEEVMERPPKRALFSPAQQRDILFRLLYADHFERFLAKKFPASKRFGIEGCESLIPGMHALIRRAAELGCESIELGMAHRGRLNVLHALLDKPLASIITEFRAPGKAEFLHVGDVKYHLGTRGSHTFGSRTVQLSLSPNPSHLEAVDPVVIGKVKAKQIFTNDTTRSKVMGLLLHGDAAFSGLGLAAEVLQLADLPEYTTGGTVHIIINNQIGFTTDPKFSRSSPHPSDVAKAVGAPIFHVNGDDPEAVAHICQLAAEWRQQFKKDVVVDVVCYRRHGHNEQDDPSVTQPLSYKLIAEHPTTLAQYTERLLSEGAVTQELVDTWAAELEARFEGEFADAHRVAPTPQDWLASNWQGEALGSLSKQRRVQPTGVPLKTLQRVGRAVSHKPQGAHLHPQVAALLDSRRKMVETGQGVDWAMAEALAFGSLLLAADAEEGQTNERNPAYPVRLSGQDSERGTFNQRHAVLYDQSTSKRYVPLAAMEEGAQQAPFMVCNSNLSEAAVLGFEYGFSLENENALVLWEAQFGDFANNAQLYIDNFIASGEERWMTASGITLLLPHGYDGQGPDHSSARLERFLQLCGDDPDHLPGTDPHHRSDMQAGFAAADVGGKGFLTREDVARFLERLVGDGNPERAELLLQEFELGGAEHIRPADWELFMAQWMRRNAEKDHNLCIVNASTPANYFHVLRRQVSRRYSKPLVIMTPKYLLHHKPCVSSLADMASGTYFRRVIADGDPWDNLRHFTKDLLPHDQIRRLIICSGKVYYQLAHARRARKVRDIALMRLEQLAPIAMDRVAQVVTRYPRAELVWVQEEPKNMGAWSYIQPRLATALRELCSNRDPALSAVKYVGRVPSASTATGSFEKHQQEMRAILEEALVLPERR